MTEPVQRTLFPPLKSERATRIEDLLYDIREALRAIDATIEEVLRASAPAPHEIDDHIAALSEELGVACPACGTETPLEVISGHRQRCHICDRVYDPAALWAGLLEAEEIIASNLGVDDPIPLILVLAEDPTEE